MANWIRIGAANEVPEEGCRVFQVEGNAIAVFHVKGGFHAIDNTCLHRGGPLGEGMLEGTIVTCPWHFWQYDVTTGKTNIDESMAVRTYPVEVRGDDLFVEIP